MPSRDTSVVDEDVALILSRQLPWDRFHNRSVLVTGATGMLPAYIVETLSRLKSDLDIDCRVVASVRNPERAKTRLAAALRRSTVKLVDFKLMDVGDWSEPIEYIVHAASPASPSDYIERPMETIEVNTCATLELLKFARKSEVEGFLFLSSAEVYGQQAESGAIGESRYGYLDPVAPRSCYAEAKRLGEALCSGARREYGLNTQIVRPFHTYGPGLRFDDGRIFAHLVDRVVAAQPIVLSGDGAAVRAFCYVADAVEAFFRVLLSGDGQPYNVGNPAESYSMNELAALLAGMYPERTSFGQTIAPSLETPSCYIPDVARLNGLGWTPTTDVRAGFRRTIGSYL